MEDRRDEWMDHEEEMREGEQMRGSWREEADERWMETIQARRRWDEDNKGENLKRC